MPNSKNDAKALLVESLKLYVTLSVACLAGLFAYLSKSAISQSVTWFWSAVISFVVAAVVSVYNINYLVKETYNGVADIYKGHCRLTNMLAIIAFIAGVLLAGIHFRTLTTSASSSPTAANQVTVGNTTITIGPNITSKVRIIRDSSGNLSEVIIN